MTPENEYQMSVLESEIFHAIQHCQYKKLALYLRHNYNLNFTSKDGRNSLFYALDINDSKKRRRMIRFCLDHGINPLQKDKINGYTVLHEAIARQQWDSVQLILPEVSSDIDWHSLDTHGRTILHQAVESNNISIIEALITIMNHYNISVDLLDKNGLTPYLLARKLHLYDMAEILLKKGHASPQKCDLKTHRTAQEWENIGTKENNLFLRKKLRQEINSAIRNGKIKKANKLKQLYYSTSSLSTYDKKRRDSYFTITTRSGLNPTSSLSINEMIDQLCEGDIPETFINSKPTKKTFHLEQMVPTSLPPITTSQRQQQPRLSFNSLIDLFQIAQLSS